MLAELLSLFLLGLWIAAWGLGGVWLARVVFRLQASEQVVVGLALGFLVENWLANWLARFLVVPAAAWSAAGLVLLAGALLAWRTARLRFTVRPLQLVALGAITVLMVMVCRGMAIFDDYAHMPTLSTMGAGDIPPHFSLDPQVLYGYHHFLLLFSAQVMRLANAPPWTAFDIGRAISFGLAVMLAGLWTARLARSPVVGVLGGIMLAFGSGGRWLLLLLPHRLVQWLSRSVSMIGSGAGSGPNLAEAVTATWAIEGGGPLAFPFAFANGILPPSVINVHSSYGVTTLVVILLLLLTFNRWQRDYRLLAGALSAVVFSAWGLLTEAELVILLVGWGLVAAAAALSTWKMVRPNAGKPGNWFRLLPAGLWQWLAVVGAGALMGFLAGGAWTDLIFKTIRKVFTGVVEPSYQTVGFTLAAPAVVSSHLGVLNLLHPAQLTTALFELGPLLLVLPLLAVYGIRAFRRQRWFEAAQAAAAVFSVAMVFVQFTGSTGVRNTPRLYVFMPLCLVFAVPLAWWWLEGRSQAVRAVVAGLGLAAVTGGIVMFGIELLAAQKPVYSYFIGPLDARMYARHWDRLPPGVLVFDPTPERSVTIFGRFTNSSTTWFKTKPEWEALREAPDPYALRAGGYEYLYLDQNDYADLDPAIRDRLLDPCVALVDQAAVDSQFRRLYDVSRCR